MAEPELLQDASVKEPLLAFLLSAPDTYRESKLALITQLQPSRSDPEVMSVLTALMDDSDAGVRAEAVRVAYSDVENRLQGAASGTEESADQADPATAFRLIPDDAARDRASALIDEVRKAFNHLLDAPHGDEVRELVETALRNLDELERLLTSEVEREAELAGASAQTRSRREVLKMIGKGLVAGASIVTAASDAVDQPQVQPEQHLVMERLDAIEAGIQHLDDHLEGAITSGSGSD